jgi:predicted nuclease with TOPRIM domain
MSDTPRTDAAIQRSCIDDLKCEWVEVGFARKLERDLKIANNWMEHHQNHVDDLIKENARLRMELDASCNAEELRQVRAENAALREDKERMDWLEKARPIAWALGNSTCGEYWLLTDLGEGRPEEAEEFPTLREAIDAARKDQP